MAAKVKAIRKLFMTIGLMGCNAPIPDTGYRIIPTWLFLGTEAKNG